MEKDAAGYLSRLSHDRLTNSDTSRTSPAAYPTIPSGATAHSLLQRLQRSATRGASVRFCGSATSDREGDEERLH